MRTPSHTCPNASGLHRICLFLLAFALTVPAFATTWYVRPDGGTRYSARNTKGQCDGTTDAPYPGKGTNRPCAFGDVRLLWQDGTYPHGLTDFPSYGWVIKAGDTVLLKGTADKGGSYRVGWFDATTPYDKQHDQFLGIPGDAYNSSMPPLPSGTPGNPTRLLGENHGHCEAQNARTQIHGGFAVNIVLNLAGTSYADVECLDITDWSDCANGGGAVHRCDRNVGTLSDAAGVGIEWANNSTHDTLKDVRVHGLAGEGMNGPTGDGVTMTNLDIIGNPGAGWDADNGTAGTGKTVVQHFNISWNGCSEQYPITDKLPYYQCTDDESLGYGDGFGTATKDSTGWQMVFDQGTVSYNTQDGLDALHLVGPGSGMTITHVLAFGNMGQQIKIGGQDGTADDNQIVTNCNALRYPIPGTPAGYNAKLSDFCRAADAGILLTVGNGSITKFRNNTIFSASTTAVEVGCEGRNGACDQKARIDFENNTLVLFKNDPEHGYKRGGSGDLSNPIYIGEDLPKDPFTNPGSTYSGNTTFHARANWKCPAPGEKHAHCGDPHLKDETWHNFGYGDMAGIPGAAPPGGTAGVDSHDLGLSLPPLRASSSVLRSRKVEALSAGVVLVAGIGGVQYLRRR